MSPESLFIGKIGRQRQKVGNYKPSHRKTISSALVSPSDINPDGSALVDGATAKSMPQKKTAKKIPNLMAFVSFGLEQYE